MKTKEFFSCEITVQPKKKQVLVALPMEVLEHINATNATKLNAIITDGIVQLTGNEPFLSIPVLSLDKNKFMPIR